MTPLKHNLVALGSAAVLAVYSAGYVRTREAAERFAAEDAQRRPPPERHPQPPVAAPTPTPVAASKQEDVHVTADSVVAPHAATKTRSTKRPAAVRPSSDSARAPVVETPVKPPEPVPPVSAPAPVVVAPAPGQTFKVTPPSPPPADTAQAADKPLKDGVYAGWGTSRHGDIQATVSIKNGKIAEAFISECM